MHSNIIPFPKSNYQRHSYAGALIDRTADRLYTEDEVMRLVGKAYAMGMCAYPHNMILDNETAQQQATPCEGDASMAKERIKRRVTIDGKLRWVTGETEQEYAEHLMNAMGVKSGGSGEKHPFKPYAKNWFEVFSKPNVSPTTANTYERQLRLYIYPTLGEMNMEDVTAADVQRMFNGMDTAEKRLTKASKDKTRMVLNMIFKQAVEDGIIPKNPLDYASIRIKGKPSEATKPYSVEQMRYIASHIADVKKLKDKAFIALLALHPLRLEEVLGLRWKDIDLVNDQIHIRCTVTHPDRNQGVFQEMTKTDGSRRTIQLVPQVKQYIGSGLPDEFVVGGSKAQSYQNVQDMCRHIKKDMGFEEAITPRRFRTTVLTDIYDTTKDIKQTQAAAGHTTAAMTLKHYVKGRAQTGDTATPIANAYGLGVLM